MRIVAKARPLMPMPDDSQRPSSSWFLDPAKSAFIVDELPSYPCCGDGEHAYWLIEKIGWNSDDVARHLARCFGLPRRAIGYAGRKDRIGITRQWFSIHAPGWQPESARCQADGLRILAEDRHRNRLRLGHLRGNRFGLRLQLHPTAHAPQAYADLHSRCQSLRREGLRNYFGAQRFGVHGQTLQCALAWARGDYLAALRALFGDPHWRPGTAPPDGLRGPAGRSARMLQRHGDDLQRVLRAPGKAWCDFLASSVQSAIFNRVLTRRLNYFGPSHLRGDAPRAIHPGTGPLPGFRSRCTDPLLACWERSWSADMPWEALERGGCFASPGARRPLLIDVSDSLHLEALANGQCLLRVELPRGSFASSLLDALGVSHEKGGGPSSTTSTTSP